MLMNIVMKNVRPLLIILVKLNKIHELTLAAAAPSELIPFSFAFPEVDLNSDGRLPVVSYLSISFRDRHKNCFSLCL